MFKMTATGRLNGHSRKILIHSPHYITLRFRMVGSACNVSPKYDPKWMIQSLDDLKRKGHIDEQWIDPQHNHKRVEPKVMKPRTITANFRGEYKGWGNKIKGWEKLNGMKIPVVD